MVRAVAQEAAFNEAVAQTTVGDAVILRDHGANSIG